MRFEVFKWSAEIVGDRNECLKWSFNLTGGVVNPDIEDEVVGILLEEFVDLLGKRKGRGEWNRADFAKISADFILVEKRCGGVSIDAINRDLKKALRPFAGRDLRSTSGLLDGGSGVGVSELQFAESAGVPGNADISVRNDEYNRAFLLDRDALDGRDHKIQAP